MTAASRRRGVLALFIGVAVSAMGYTILIAYIPLVAEDLLGSARWAGLPSALATTGVALGATLLSSLIARRGWRTALVTGYWGGGLAAAAAGVSAAFGRFPVMIAGVFLIGAGYSSNRLSRYVAADLADPDRRAAAIGWNIWAATLGSVTGPLLLGSTRRATLSFGLPAAVGPFIVASAAFGVAGFAIRGLFPARIGRAAPRGPEADARATPTPGPASAAPAPAAPASPAGIRLAIAALVVSQVVMVLVMTMTPIHIRHGGLGLETVGAVMAAHTFGMFALSPLAGIVSDRIGRPSTIALGVVLLVAAGGIASVARPGSWALAAALMLLGLGWCGCFVAGSALLSESTVPSRRVRVQGRVDALVWGLAAAAGIGSGVLLTLVGYPALCLVAAVASLVPLVWIRGAGRTPELRRARA